MPAAEHTLSDLGVFEDVDGRKLRRVDALEPKDLNGRLREAALRAVGRALHEQHHGRARNHAVKRLAHVVREAAHLREQRAQGRRWAAREEVAGALQMRVSLTDAAAAARRRRGRTRMKRDIVAGERVNGGVAAEVGRDIDAAKAKRLCQARERREARHTRPGTGIALT